ncbi:hypothetical protein [Prosthecobacter sp.]|uniref:hypothetical protein n=1 Tax=Prosthecobacter sp. TaxID=1965333 RepID=UPI001D773983|nr:hypothetical protein [Prosthecobacter sp.]MCB1275541.1 hypothetical protein [Prosthecobacter sp.]
MKSTFVCLFAVAVLPLYAAGELSKPIEALRSVQKEGEGNETAAKAWQEIVKADASNLPEVLKGMNGANPLAENWLRAAVGVIADEALKAKTMPVEALVAFLKDTKNSSGPRVVAFDLIHRADEKLAEELTPTLLEDPSSDLRRHPVAKLIAAGDAALDKKDKDAAMVAFGKGLVAARDEDQIKTLTKKLRDLGQKVDLPKHFGFLMSWKLIAPFSNADRGGFDKVYPPEKELHFDAIYEGKSKKVEWVDFTSADEYGKIDFNKPFGMEKSVVGYAATDFFSEEDRQAEIRIGCKNGWKVWLNGELLFARDEYHRGAKLDQYKLPCQLKKGKNTILVKCCQNEQTEQWTVEWEFQLRVCDATGTAILAAK